MKNRKKNPLGKIVSFFGVCFFILAASGVLSPLVDKFAAISAIPLTILGIVVLVVAAIFTRLILGGKHGQ